MYIRDCPSAVTMGEYLYQKEGYRMEKEVGPKDDEYPENDIMKVMNDLCIDNPTFPHSFQNRTDIC